MPCSVRDIWGKAIINGNYPTCVVPKQRSPSGKIPSADHVASLLSTCKSPLPSPPRNVGMGKCCCQVRVCGVGGCCQVRVGGVGGCCQVRVGGVGVVAR